MTPLSILLSGDSEAGSSFFFLFVPFFNKQTQNSAPATMEPHVQHTLTHCTQLCWALAYPVPSLGIGEEALLRHTVAAPLSFRAPTWQHLPRSLPSPTPHLESGFPSCRLTLCSLFLLYFSPEDCGLQTCCTCNLFIGPARLSPLELESRTCRNPALLTTVSSHPVHTQCLVRSRRSIHINGHVCGACSSAWIHVSASRHLASE